MAVQITLHVVASGKNTNSIHGVVFDIWPSVPWH